MIFRDKLPRDFKLEKLLELAILVFIICWAFAVYSEKLARVLFVSLTIVFFTVKSSVNLVINPENNYFRLFNFRLLLYFPFLFLLLIIGQQISNLILGLQGFDFAIFTHSINNFASQGEITTTLLSGKSASFLTHHFTPILIIPGILAKFMPASYAGIFFQMIALAIGIFALYLFSRTLGFSKNLTALFIILLCLNPSFRVGVSWEIRDEIFGIGALGLSFYLYEKRYFSWMFLSLFFLTLCKETYFILIPLFLISAYIFDENFRNSLTYKQKIFSVLLITLCGLGLWCYVISPLPFFDKTFDAIGKVSKFSQLFEISNIIKKLNFLLKSLIFLLLCISALSKKGFIYAITSFSFLVPILISNASGMYHLYNYYSVLPTFILFFGALKTIRERYGTNPKIPSILFLILISLELSLAGFSRPLRATLDIFKRPNNVIYEPENFNYTFKTKLNKNNQILADDYDLPFFIKFPNIHRLWSIERSDLPWTHYVERVQKDPKNPLLLKELPKIVKEQASYSFEDQGWEVYERKNKR